MHIVDAQHYRTILERYGAQHLGYYVVLKTEGPLPLAKMATRCKLGTRVCAQIEQDLAELGLIRVKGKGLHRIILNVADEGDDEVRELIEHFGRATGRDPTVRSWASRQEPAAREVLKEYGLDACKWMIDYITSVKKLDMYSLRLIHTLSGELLPKYHQQKERKKLVRNVPPIEWREPPHEEPIRDSISPDEVSGLLSFDIQL